MALSAVTDIILGRTVDALFDRFLGYINETRSGQGNLVDMFIGQFNEKKWQDLLEKFEILKQHMIILGSVIEEVQGLQVTNESFLLWLGEIIEGRYQGEYLLDTMETQPNSSSTRVDQRSYDEILCLVKKLCDLKSDTTTFLKILERFIPLDSSVTNYLNMNDEKMFGRIVEKARVINYLLNEDLGDSQNVKILTITGVEGHGKSALAHYFFTEMWVLRRFPLHVWLDATYMDDATQLLKKLLDELPSSSSDTSEDMKQLDLLIETVMKRLRDEKFLLVIDNAPKFDMGIWSILQHCLKSGNRGSKMIITSRLIEVIDHRTVESITMDPMRNGEYCCFFKKLIFEQNSQNYHEEYRRLAKIAKEIACKLNGSPLAAQDMASRLKKNISIQHWENILQELNQEGREFRGRNITTGSNRKYEEIARAAADANLRAAAIEKRLENMQRQMEKMSKSVQQISEDIRPSKRARHYGEKPMPVHNNQMDETEDVEHFGDPHSYLSEEYENMRNRILSASRGLNGYTVHVPDGAGFFKKEFTIFCNDVSELLNNEWLDVTIISFFMMYLYDLCTKKEITTIGFLDPNMINETVLQSDSSRNCAINYMANALDAQRKKFVLAPYFERQHWVLLVIQPQTCKIWCFDSLLPENPKYEIHQTLKYIFDQNGLRWVDEARKEATMDWVQHKKTPKQPNSWECGYYVMNFMLDIVNSSSSLPVESIPTSYPLQNIDKIRLKWAKYLLKSKSMDGREDVGPYSSYKANRPVDGDGMGSNGKRKRVKEEQGTANCPPNLDNGHGNNTFK